MPREWTAEERRLATAAIEHALDLAREAGFDFDRVELWPAAWREEPAWETPPRPPDRRPAPAPHGVQLALFGERT